MNMKRLWLALIFAGHLLAALSVPVTPINTVFIIVPGTWSTNQPWYTVNGDFFDAFKQTLPNDNYQLIWFRWYAKNSNKHRKQAVRELAHFVRSLPSTTIIHMIAHSHGVNVVLGASQLLGRKKSTRTITTLYALGAPIHEEEYAPNMQIIKKIYNLYSLNDPIQTIWGYQRVFRSHPAIYNIRVFINDHEPTHEELHHPIIGRWLTMLPCLSFPNNAIARFHDNRPPEMTYDNQIELINEKPLNLATIFETRKKADFGYVMKRSTA